MAGKETHKPLQHRVDDYLRYKIPAYSVEEIQDESAGLLLEQIREAEHQLEAVQKRIARLKGMLAELHSDPNSS